mmetsp:Transcript_5568/g.15677  ORF Transcript_5568/g.15677 Transcript_5568/m.15677 type:complete len:201 (-) Transcript_5568:47-649(-)
MMNVPRHSKRSIVKTFLGIFRLSYMAKSSPSTTISTTNEAPQAPRRRSAGQPDSKSWNRLLEELRWNSMARSLMSIAIAFRTQPTTLSGIRTHTDGISLFFLWVLGGLSNFGTTNLGRPIVSLPRRGIYISCHWPLIQHTYTGSVLPRRRARFWEKKTPAQGCLLFSSLRAPSMPMSSRYQRQIASLDLWRTCFRENELF